MNAGAVLLIVGISLSFFLDSHPGQHLLIIKKRSGFTTILLHFCEPPLKTILLHFMSHPWCDHPCCLIDPTMALKPDWDLWYNASESAFTCCTVVWNRQSWMLRQKSWESLSLSLFINNWILLMTPLNIWILAWKKLWKETCKKEKDLQTGYNKWLQTLVT